MSKSTLSDYLGLYWANHPRDFSNDLDNLNLADVLYFASDIAPLFTIEVSKTAINLMKDPQEALMVASGPLLDLICDKPNLIKKAILDLIHNEPRVKWAIAHLHQYVSRSDLLSELFDEYDLIELIGGPMPETQS